MDVDPGFLRCAEGFVCLQGNEDPVADSVVFECHFGRSEFLDHSFDVVYHITRIILVKCKIMIIICKIKGVFLKFAG